LNRLLILTFISLPLFCQTEGHRWNANVGGGFTMPAGNLDRRVDTGWNVKGGVGLNANDYLGAVLEFQYNGFGLGGDYLRSLAVPDGNARIWSVTLNPVVRVNPRGAVGLYVTGGGGFYQRTVEFTQPSTAAVTVFDPWFGYFYNALVPANQVLGSFTQNKAGINGGGGLTFGVPRTHGKFFAEARYHYVFTDRVRTRYIPVTFGFRW